MNISDEAVEAAHKAWREQAATDGSIFEYNLRAALEAAAPILLSHEREETRLAHLDAMINRETKRAELAQAWEQGALSAMSNTSTRLTNPYRSQA